MRRLFGRDGVAIDTITAGSAFRKVGTGHQIEMAQVSGVYTDGAGIPHVRFELVLERPNQPPYKAGPRVLSAAAFLETYPERLGG